jgi:hypothetical protein
MQVVLTANASSVSLWGAGWYGNDLQSVEVHRMVFNKPGARHMP